MRAYFLAVLFTLYIRFVGWTSRIRFIEESPLPEKPFIYVFWHFHILLLAYSHRGRAARIVASTSKDGDVSALSNRQFGYRIIRGTASSAKEGARTAAKIIRVLKEGNTVALTPDGPKGPRLSAKKGVAHIAGKVGCPVVPVAWAAKKKIFLKSWDRTMVPLPFNKAVVLNGSPMYIDKNEQVEISLKKIEDSLNSLYARATGYLENT
ncbi:MAG: lysophospholipid acyltransferase family protein [Elusimicrobia bacterium]|nr:lysophospholipid acyltransferase family protein [Elusimicrobiota bacterium]